MQFNKDGKRCVVCDKDLARFWGRNLCEPCLKKALQDDNEEKDKRHASGNVQTS